MCKDVNVAKHESRTINISYFNFDNLRSTCKDKKWVCLIRDKIPCSLDKIEID